jgi:hypothetical protein
MLSDQRQLAIQCIDIACQTIKITTDISAAYREGMKYGTKLLESFNYDLKCLNLADHYTHATATFVGMFLLRLARLL